MNAGLTGTELAEALELPCARRALVQPGLHGTLNHNAKAVYQRYMGWYDGNPASLWPLPPEEEQTLDRGRRVGPRLAQAQAAVEGRTGAGPQPAESDPLRWGGRR